MKSSVHKLQKILLTYTVLYFQNEYLHKKVISIQSGLPPLALGYLQASLIIPVKIEVE